jgi:hypothetical protein
MEEEVSVLKVWSEGMDMIVSLRREGEDGIGSRMSSTSDSER